MMIECVCDLCKESQAIKMVMVAVRTQTKEDNRLSASRMEFKAIPMCAECLRERRESTSGTLAVCA